MVEITLSNPTFSKQHGPKLAAQNLTNTHKGTRHFSHSSTTTISFSSVIRRARRRSALGCGYGKEQQASEQKTQRRRQEKGAGIGILRTHISTNRDETNERAQLLPSFLPLHRVLFSPQFKPCEEKASSTASRSGACTFAIGKGR